MVVADAGSQVAGSDPLQQQFPPRPGERRVLITWTARYRTRKLGTGSQFVPGPGLVVPAALSSLAQQLVLDSAWLAFDVTDMKTGTLSLGPDALVGQPNAPRFVPGGGTTPIA